MYEAVEGDDRHDRDCSGPCRVRPRPGGAAVPADAVGQHRRADDAGVGLQAPRRAAAAAGRRARTSSSCSSTTSGPAQPSTFGGEINTPTLDRIAKGGIAYNRFHTTAMCSPTRASLLTGRNHHRVGNGQIAELANDWDGYSGVIPKSSATVAEVLQELRLRHRRLGQVAQHAGRADDRRRPVRLLADRLWLRVLLRLPRRRGLAVRAAPGAQHHGRRPAIRPHRARGIT